MNGKIIAIRWGRALLDRLLPNACALCGADSDDALCPGCEAQFFGPAAAVARCVCCANPLASAARVGEVPVSTTRVGPTALDIASPGGGKALDRTALDIASPGDGEALDRTALDIASPGDGEALDRTAAAGDGEALAHTATAGLVCGVCLRSPPAFDCTLVAADYVLPVDQLVLQLKFGHRLALAPLCARLLRDAVLRQDDIALPALLCPVPLGPRRLAERGYNQALEIARPLARSMGVALEARLLQRVHETAAQSSVAPAERQANIAGAFAVPDATLVAGRHIGVVDDVMTSGRTLNELAATLKRHGAARVSNFVFARTPPH
ncbi:MULTISPECIES: ComF family protein [unclassified Duganella]|uniref:ComF family protein n=1 Tax=unclassified Duganella TaxID=2636909 RepID=UPI00088E4E78|nr:MULTISPECIES: ComF family protein [unclassified Duganella]SDG69124.1 comF family protein [Duganella sp. OV458]SDJ94486.1 comF family protein [Duganella sp. OV510]